MSEPESKVSNVRLMQEMPRQIERMHRRFLDVVRLEMGRVGVRDISPVQILMLSNIGTETISVRDLIERGYYLGSNASYNLKQLVEGGYVDRQASKRDRRSALLKITSKGTDVLSKLSALQSQWAEPILRDNNGEAVETTYKMLRTLERCWSDAVRYAEPAAIDDF
ncbi:MAG: MarR family transcriptional regulator [Proteobacteria bacterium]|jgi:DNA-binding MarR family transcriptional regulator|nr:MarR family transcriptional regulator [Alphaproteobacteria bacterium]NCC03829.1 MarR family transcriptional regulator [Pseudomonadota bacterium]